jgi:hypothetical protein
VGQELLGFAPDLDPRTPGCITAGSAFIPTIRGVAGAPTPNDVGVPVLDLNLPCLGAVTVRNLSGTRRTFAGTVSALLELIGNAWVNRTRSSGPYNTGGGRWRFTQFGDFTIATNRLDEMQVSAPGGQFDNLGGAPPKARFIDTVDLFVIAADTNEATFGDQPDRWWCSALGNPSNWVPSISTQSASGRILDSDGPITASKGLGSSWIIYKQNAIYVGTYQGGDVIWSFERVPGDVGCVSHDSIVNLQSAHIFRGRDDFYIFDGNRAQPIGRNIKEFFARNASRSFSSRITALHDRPNSLIYFFYPSTSSSGEIDAGVVFNYEAGKWGVHNLKIQAAVEYISGQMTWDQLGTIAQQWDDLPKVSWDDPSWIAGAETPAVFIPDPATGGGKIAPLSGIPDIANLRTWILGDPRGFLGMSRVLPRFSRHPSKGTMTGFFSDRLDTELVPSGAMANLFHGRFSYLRNAVYHQFAMDLNGDFEMIDFDVEAKRSSQE